MRCEETIGLLSDRLKGLLEPEDARRLGEHIESCDACRNEAASVEELWNHMDGGDGRVPHERMRARFHAALATYDEGANTSAVERVARYVWPKRPALQLGVAVAILVAGVILGRGFPGQTDDELASLREDIRVIGLALLDHQSAAERLRGVAWAQRATAASGITDALLDVARNDRNVNVRLAAVEALSEWLHQSEVGAALTEALLREQAPLMQITMATMLLRNGVDGSVAAVEAVAERPDVDPSVRDYLRAIVPQTQENRPNAQPTQGA